MHSRSTVIFLFTLRFLVDFTIEKLFDHFEAPTWRQETPNHQFQLILFITSSVSDSKSIPCSVLITIEFS